MKRKDKILELTTIGATPEEITRTLKISDDILKKEICLLQRDGHNITRQFYYNGVQKYVIQKGVPDNITHILGTPKNGIFRAIGASDYHIGSKKQNLNYIKRIYEFAIENDIHIIFNCGDLVEGLLNTNFHQSHYEQIEYLLENHPYNDRIISFISLGNHDSDLVRTTGLDLHTILNQNRNDLVSLGYGINELNIGNNKILMCHHANKIKEENAHLKLTGHGHRYHFLNHNNQPMPCLPTASNNIHDSYPPGFVDIQLEITEGKIIKGTFFFYMFNKKQLIRANYDTFNYETSFISQKEKELILTKFH